MYKEYLPKPQTPEKTAAILMDEVSAVHKGLLYQEVFPYDQSYYTMNCRAEMGDVVTMVKLLCEQCGWDFQEIQDEGRQRFLERMSEVKKGTQQKGIPKCR